MRLRFTTILNSQIFSKKVKKYLEMSKKYSIFVIEKENNRDMKKIVAWFKTTKMWMNINNRLNGVEILTEEEYFNLWNGKIVEV